MLLCRRQLVSYMKEHFRDDERGRRMAFYFWPWHFAFFCRCVTHESPTNVWFEEGAHSYASRKRVVGQFQALKHSCVVVVEPPPPPPRLCRYRPLPAAVYAEQSRQHPLIATRPEGVADPRVSCQHVLHIYTHSLKPCYLMHCTLRWMQMSSAPTHGFSCLAWHGMSQHSTSCVTFS